jgi:hypothetical protein
MIEKPTPFSTSLEVRAFLYNSVVLPWETKSAIVRDENINGQKLHASLGFSVEYFNTLDELEARDIALANDSLFDGDFVCFHNETKPEFSAGYECLLKRLRDAAAHGHFSTTSDNRILIHHRYAPRGKPEKTRIVGKLSLVNLQKLMAFVSGEKSKSRPVRQKAHKTELAP